MKEDFIIILKLIKQAVMCMNDEKVIRLICKYIERIEENE